MLSMNSEVSVYLKPSTKLDLVACGWMAWSHLISPVQHAMNIAYRQLPMLRSFVANPSVHIAASKDPEFFTGAFVRVTEKDIQAIRDLLKRTETDCAHLIRFADDLRRFSRTLQEQATGYKLDELYEPMSDSLRGLVELAYDTNNAPKLKIIEELVYPSELDNRITQEVRLSDVSDEDRGFFLNTPMLDTPDSLTLPIAFDDRRIDLLAKARRTAMPMRDLVVGLGLDEEKANRLLRFVCTETTERRDPDYQGDGVRVRYFGHACVLLQSDKSSILIDPAFAWDTDREDGRYTFQDLPDYIDYVVISHNHQDHYLPDVLVQLRDRVGTIVVPRNNPWSLVDNSLRLLSRRLGFEKIIVAEPFQRLDLPDGAITTVPFFGEHCGLDVDAKQGIHISLKGRTFLFAVDSDCVDRMHYHRIVKLLGPVETLFIGMECVGASLSWLYGPYLTTPPTRRNDESRRLNGSDSVRAWNVVQEIGCRRVFIYAMGQESWVRHLFGLQYTSDSTQIVESDRFVERCRDSGLAAVRLKGSGDLTF